MSFCDVYIGDLDDPRFDWNNKSNEKWNIGNAPYKIGPIFPPVFSRPFSKLNEKIKNKVFHGKQVDWGASAAIVTKNQIEDFIEECYKDSKEYLDPSHTPHLYEQLQELKEFVLTLDFNKKYYLVASEL